MKKRKSILCLILVVSILSQIPGFTVEAWAGSNHQSMVTDLINSKNTSSYKNYYNSNEIKLLNDVIVKCDNVNYFRNMAGNASSTTTSHLHGKGNYVKNIKFLFDVAMYFRNEYDSSGKSHQKVAQYVYDQKNKQNYPSSEITDDLIPIVNKLMSTNCLAGVEESTGRLRGVKVLGLALHLAGDLYAHRTLVPKNTKLNTSTTPSTRDGITIYKADFTSAKWTTLTSSLNSGTLKFLDITSNGANATWYEDNTKFFSTRYTHATNFTMDLLISRYANNIGFGIRVLLPWDRGGWKDNGIQMKLNSFEHFAKKAGYSDSSISAYGLSWGNISN